MNDGGIQTAVQQRFRFTVGVKSERRYFAESLANSE
jgi:hypothetical protein